MNRRDLDVLLAMAERQFSAQRELAEYCGCSLGGANGALKNLTTAGYVDDRMRLTGKGKSLLAQRAPQRAVLLAAGFGVRQPPTYEEIPKPLLQVQGQRLIERLICQLQEAGIREIYVVVGFAKEKFEYLIDRYGIQLIVNAAYAQKHNLHSLALAEAHLENSYIVPCDLWCRENPFRKRELYSWYMVREDQSTESALRLNRKLELTAVPSHAPGNVMLGISYLVQEDAARVRAQLLTMDGDRRYKGSFWEEALYDGNKLFVGARQVSVTAVTEINSFEDMKELTSRSRQIAQQTICKALHVTPDQITGLKVIKKGMINTTFFFRCQQTDYCIRIPTEATNGLICRTKESQVYQALQGQDFAEEVLWFDRSDGIKISRYIADAQPCDPNDPHQAARCMERLRQFHDANLQVEHSFDLFAAIEYFESLWEDQNSLYTDYRETKKRIFSLRSYIDAQEKNCCLTHIDPVAENFLMGQDTVRLIDWEYAAMQDPHLDIAMFCLQAMYDRSQVDAVIGMYFPQGCPGAVRKKIYCYIAAAGLLWSNWCEHEIRHGTEFGAYSLLQYRYAKEYYEIVQKEDFT